LVFPELQRFDETKRSCLLFQVLLEATMAHIKYGYTKKVNATFGDALSQVAEELKNEGFGVLTEIDVTETFKKKLDLDFRPYRILGACNPELASRALGSESEVGLLLPCNVVVQQSDKGEVTVSIADPKAMFTLVENPDVAGVAEEVDRRLRRVLEALS
jgi:uncharacterized protein (DUF302 family)